MTDQHTLQHQIFGDELLTREQVATLLDLTPLSIARMVARGELPCIRYSRRVRFRATDVRAWLISRTIYIYNGPTKEERELIEIRATMHDACRCEHVAEALGQLLSKSAIARDRDTGPKSEPDAPTKNDEEELLTAKQIAEILKLSPVSITRMLASGRLPAIKVGQRRLVRRRDLERWLKHPHL